VNRATTIYVVDAQTGSILSKRSGDAHYVGIGTARTLYSGEVPIDVHGPGDSMEWELVDMHRGPDFNAGVFDWKFDDDPMQDHTNLWGDGKKFLDPSSFVNRQTAGVDAKHGVEVVWDMMKNVFHWWGLDDDGDSLDLFVHDETLQGNAMYSGWDENLYFGDGNGNGACPFVSVDIVAHEWGHAVNDDTADLSGGLNEANSDILGTLARIYDRTGGFAAGLDHIPNTTARSFYEHRRDLADHCPGVEGIRPLYNPVRQYWFEDLEDLEEHEAMGPVSRMFFFLAQGADPNVTNVTWSWGLPWGMTGIGNQKAGHIWVRALTHYMDSDDYDEVRAAMVQASDDLYGAGSTESQAVRNAWAGINVGANASSYPDAPDKITEVDPNNTTDDAKPITFTGPTIGGLRKITLKGTRPTADDIDKFYVNVPCGDALRVRAGTDGTANLSLRRSNGDILDSSNAEALTDATVAFRNTGCSGGSLKLYVEMRPQGSDPATKYTLWLERGD
jgi:Zn-dependent metalloprotease